MSPVFAMRLGLDLVAAGLLTFGLSYWWLGDAAHEVAGTFLLALIVVHNGFNRRWYGKAARTRHGAAGLFNAGVIVVLAVAMTMLLVTSAMITTVLPDWIPSCRTGSRPLPPSRSGSCTCWPRFGQPWSSRSIWAYAGP